ncbi:ABC transporter substrate-binding protein [Geoalkalibacter sp.]|uniref:ABC transporter substrate-binding protein n=1 Tax=Geoalkalibacter sp. TaxID=3041440 RepID=UPI00272E4CC0|nr:ABC transporter substrate-binding protein [Geoalkalibacter sp.]
MRAFIGLRASRRLPRSLSWWLLILILTAPLGCRRPEPIAVGFLGGLTGRVADLGIAGRDGAILAVEERNRAGGIHGRLLELRIADDAQDELTARAALQKLLDEGVVAVIGPMTSSMALAVQPLADARRTVLLSPTVSSDALSGRDDFFLRTASTNAQGARLLADYAAGELGLTSINVLYDLGNRAYGESLYRSFASEFEARGGRIAEVLTYTSGPEVNFLDLARQAGEKAEALLIIANALDTGMLAQQLAKLGIRLPLMTGEWAATGDIIEYGGAAVDGLRFFNTFDPGHDSPAYRRFRAAFEQRFGYDGGFAAAHAFDAAQVLFRALEKNPGRSGLKEALLESGGFQGLQTELRLDRHGDVVRPHFPMTIRNGRFQVDGRVDD